MRPSDNLREKLNDLLDKYEDGIIDIDELEERIVLNARTFRTERIRKYEEETARMIARFTTPFGRE